MPGRSQSAHLRRGPRRCPAKPQQHTLSSYILTHRVGPEVDRSQPPGDVRTAWKSPLKPRRRGTETGGSTAARRISATLPWRYTWYPRAEVSRIVRLGSRPLPSGRELPCEPVSGSPPRDFSGCLAERERPLLREVDHLQPLATRRHTLCRPAFYARGRISGPIGSSCLIASSLASVRPGRLGSLHRHLRRS